MARRTIPTEKEKELIIAAYHIIHSREFQMLNKYCHKRGYCEECITENLVTCPVRCVTATFSSEDIYELDGFAKPYINRQPEPIVKSNRLAQILGKQKLEKEI